MFAPFQLRRLNQQDGLGVIDAPIRHHRPGFVQLQFEHRNVLAFVRVAAATPGVAVSDPDGTAQAVRAHTEALREQIQLSRQQKQRFDYGIPFLAELT